MTAQEQTRIPPAEIVLGLVGLAFLLAGAWRFVRLGHFTLVQAGYCLLWVPVAMLILLIADYTLHHARLAFVIVLMPIVLLVVRSPSFCVGLGLGLIGILLMQRRGQ